MTTQENVVENDGPLRFKDFFQEVGDPIAAWNFDIFSEDKPLWLATKVRIADGKLYVQQVLNASGAYDLCRKTVRIVFYTNEPSVATEFSFLVGRLENVNLSCDASSIEGCVEVEMIYKCKFVSMTNHGTQVSA